MPVQVTSYIWIVITSPSAPQYILTQVCPRAPSHLINIRRPIHPLDIPTACSITSPYFYLPPTYHDSHWAVNISLLSANINMINISSLDFCVWHHLEDCHNNTQLQHEHHSLHPGEQTNVTFGNIYQKYYYCLCPYVDPHLSPPTAQQWVSMCIRLICVHIDHLEVLVGIEME